MNEKKCGVRYSTDDSDPCLLMKGHSGPHRYAGQYWPQREQTDAQGESDLRDYLTEAFTVEDLRHALYNEREKTSQVIRKLVAQRDELLAALKHIAIEARRNGTDYLANDAKFAIARCEAAK